MDQLHIIQKELQNRIANSFINFKKKGQAKMTKEQAFTRLESLEGNYKEFLHNHTLIITSENYAAEHAYVTSGLMSMVEESYYDVKSEYRGWIDKLDTPIPPLEFQQPAAAVSSIQNSFASLGFQLPKIDLPTFSGVLEEWAH